MVLCAGVLLAAGCSSMAPKGPPPRACGLAEFGEAPGLTLPAPQKSQASGSKSAPAISAAPLAVDKSPLDAGKWYDAAPGWKAWRLWLRSDTASSMAVQLQPFDLPAGAEMWVCAPDGTSRQGPFSGRGPTASGELGSAAVKGPEVWLELLVPADDKDSVKLKVARAFGGVR
jgi:hypothetical protein